MKENRPSTFSALRFLLIFAVVFVVLQTIYVATRAQTRNALSHYANAVVSARVINLLTPGERVVAREGALTARDLRLEIYKGCEGIEVMLILVAALAGYPLGSKKTVMGLACGLGFIYLLNQVRIVSLYYLLRHHPSVFDVAHVSLWQSVLVLAAGLFFLFWIQRATGVALLLPKRRKA